MRKVLLIILIQSQIANAQYEKGGYTDWLKPAIFSTTMVMMHDVVNPPAASRFYAYEMLGAYAISALNSKAVIAPSQLIKNLPEIKIMLPQKEYNTELAALYCILETGRLMLPSGQTLAEEQEKFLASIKRLKLSGKIVAQSIAVAQTVAFQVVAYAKGDNYGKLSARLRYTPAKGEGYWYPTPPSYMEAVEPNWKIIRPLLIDSSAQCKPLPPIKYSTDSTSDFYKLASEVYFTANSLSDEQLHVASFWDCNPFVVATAGHMMLGFKKISPGGHWMNIAAIAAVKANLSFEKSVQLLAIEAITQMDAFISCWDEKYRSNRIRPETYINKYINVKWQPLLQTPPFPEYTSGHSVVSTASAEVLTFLLGKNFNYTDNTEDMFEIPERSFNSFNHAAEEASISRLYGGIHYRDAIENGQKQGAEIGKVIVGKIRAAGIMPFIK